MAGEAAVAGEVDNVLPLCPVGGAHPPSDAVSSEWVFVGHRLASPPDLLIPWVGKCLPGHRVAGLDHIAVAVHHALPTSQDFASHTVLHLGIAQTSLALRSTSAKVGLHIVETVGMDGGVMSYP